MPDQPQLRHHVKSPPQFNHEDKVIKWKLWKELFSNFLVASNYAALGDGEKRAILLANLHPKTYEIFSTLQNKGTSYDEAVKALDGYFGEKHSRVFAVYNFRKLKQENGQDIQTFMSVLHTSASECEYAANYDNEIKQQLISGVRDSRICQELLMLDEKTTLEACVTKAVAMEASVCEQGGISGVSDSGTFFVKKGGHQFVKKQQSFSSECRYCGKNQRHPRKEDCPAWGKKCNKCTKPNHFSSVCKSSNPSGFNKPGKVGAINLGEVQNHVDYTSLSGLTGSIISSTASAKSVSVLLNGNEANWLVDTGSPYTLISSDFARNHNIQWQESSKSSDLQSATGSALIESGRVISELSIFGHKFHQSIRIISNLQFGAILGRDSLSQFSQITLKTSGSGPELVLACGNKPSDVEGIVSEYSDCFDKPLKNSQLNIAPEPMIELSVDAKAVRCPSRKYTPDDVEFINKTVKSLLENEIVEESCSEWRSQPVVVSKRGGGRRMAIDYSVTVNKFSKLDAFPLPLISDLVQEAAKYKYFSVVDITQAYHQVPLTPDDMEKTAFEAMGKLFHYRRLSFGLTNAGPKFQRIMVRWFGDLDGVKIYLDDCVIGGRTQEEHNENLARFLERCRELNVSLNRKKCSFGVRSLSWLGYLIENNELRPDPERTLPLEEYPVPKTMKELERFLGMATYYSKFVVDFATLAAPLMDVKNSKEFCWNERLTESFSEIKARILKSFLAIPDYSQEFTLETDASGTAVAGVLMQGGRPVAVTSRRVSKTETSWAAVELEALAIVHSVAKFRSFLLGRPFKLYTDQRALSFLFSDSPKSSCKNNKLIRWRQQLSEYKYTICYKPGKENASADAFSRAFVVQSVKGLFSIEAFLGAQDEDPEIVSLRNNLESAEKPSQVSLGLWSNRRRFRLVKGVLVMTETSGELRIVCPEKMKLAVLERSHDKFGHMGVDTTMKLVRDSFFWVSLRSDVEKYVEKCGICRELKPKFFKHEDGTLITSTKPMERLSIDFVGPKMTRSGSPKWILTVVDEFSRYVEAFVLKSTTSSEVIKKLQDEIFSRYGIPSSVHSDRGPQLMSDEFSSYFKSIGVKLSHSSKYNPRGNGQCERYNGEIQRIMARVLRQEGMEDLDWEDVLPEVLWIMRAVTCKSTGKSPHDAFFNFTRKVFADGNIKQLEPQKIGGFPDGLTRGSPVFVRNFVRKQKSDPVVKARGIVQEVLSPQLAEVLIGSKTEMLNTRHLAPRSEEVPEVPLCLPPRADNETVESDTKEMPNETVIPPKSTVETKQKTMDETQKLPQTMRRSGRITKRPEKLDL